MKQNLKQFMKLGAEVRKTRRLQEIPLNDISKSLQITKQALSKIEKGKSEPGVMTFLKLWKLLGKKFEDLEQYLDMR